MAISPTPRIACEPLDGASEVAGVRGPPSMYYILDCALSPIAVMDGARQIVCYVNPAFCQMTGKSREEMIGHAFSEILPEGDECLLLLDRVYRTGKSESHKGKEDAAPHPLHGSFDVWPVMTEPPEYDCPIGVILQVTETAPFHHRRVTAMNEALLVSAVRQHELMEVAETLNTKLQAEIEERKRVQDALLRSELLASAGRMAASIAHEINNPLEAVINTLYLARTTDDLPEPARAYLDSADGELLRIAHLARQTLGFYREFSAATSNSASALMASVINLLQSKIRNSGATIEQQCNEQLQVMGVAGELRQIFANLLANSLDAVGRDGRIILRASASLDPSDGRRRVRITVADCGHGMETPTMKKIFEPFFTTKGAVGTGLGLWVCKQLVEKNRGSIRVRSNTNGNRRGTTFSVVLPENAPMPVAICADSG
jgi:two-component system, NtrC family, sensor kinase